MILNHVNEFSSSESTIILFAQNHTRVVWNTNHECNWTSSIAQFLPLCRAMNIQPFLSFPPSHWSWRTHLIVWIRFANEWRPVHKHSNVIGPKIFRKVSQISTKKFFAKAAIFFFWQAFLFAVAVSFLRFVVYPVLITLMFNHDWRTAGRFFLSTVA